MTWSLCLTVAACAEPSSGPIAARLGAPEGGGASTPVRSAIAATDARDGERLSLFAAALTATGGKASGHADIFATARQNIIEEEISFTAMSSGASPAAKGQFEGHALRFTGETVNIHADVTCMTIVGNQAWIGARITRATVDEQPVPNSAGTPLTFRVLDNGEGASVADNASLWFLGFADEIAFCNARPTTNALRVSTTANIQVKPE